MKRLVKLAVRAILLLVLLVVVGTGVVTGAFMTSAPVPLVEAVQSSALELATIDLPEIDGPEALGDAVAEIVEQAELEAVLEAVWGDDQVDVTATVTSEAGVAELTVTAEDHRPTEMSGFSVSLPTRITTTLTAHVEP